MGPASLAGVQSPVKAGRTHADGAAGWVRALGPAGLALLLLLSFGASGAQGREVRVGHYQNPPKIYTDGDGVPQGFFPDIVTAIAREEGWQVTYVPCVWDECVAMLSRGDIDLMPDMAYSDNRAERFSFNRVGVLQGWTDVVMGPGLGLEEVEDLAGLRLAVLDGSIQQVRLRRMMATLQLAYVERPVKSIEDGFVLVSEGGADAAISNNFFTSAYASRHGLLESAVLLEPVMFYFAAPKGKNAELLAQIDAHVRAWKLDADSPFYQAMRKALVPSQVESGLSRQQRLALVALGVVGLLGGLWILALRWQVRRRTVELTSSNARLTHLLGATPVVLYQVEHWDKTPRIRSQDNELSRVFGFQADQTWTLEAWLERIHEDDRERVHRQLLALPQAGRVVQNYRLLDQDGAVRHVRDEATWLPDDGEHAAEVVGCLSDLTHANEQAERLNFLTHYDGLTSLANRTQLETALAAAVDAAVSSGSRVALVVLNVDRLQRVNDTMGHEAGNAVLTEVGRRLKTLVGADATAARLGGDEFAVVLPDIADDGQVADLASRLLQEVKRPITHAGELLGVTGSIGISLFPNDGATPGALMMGADTALGHAKQEGRDRLHFVTQKMNLRVQRSMAVERQLRFALERDELSLQYQPMASLGDGSHCGVEALLRWNNPELGSVSPAEFIAVAEEAGLMESIGEWVLCTACRQAKAWSDQGLPPIRTAVNVSTLQIRSGTLPGLLRRIQSATGLDLRWLEIELTESVMMQDSEAALAQMRELSAMGVSVSLDDFGTGFSSLSYLSLFPFDSLKIDRSFIHRMIDDHRSAAITQAAIGIAHGLEMKVVAEGVETRQQLDYLRAAGCDEMQGYLLSRPVGPAEIARLFAGPSGLSFPHTDSSDSPHGRSGRNTPSD